MSNEVFTVAGGRKIENGMKITVDIVIARKQIAYLLTTAFEGGIGYWCPRQEFRYREPKAWEPVLDEGDEKPERWKAYDYPLLPGGSVTFFADEDAPVKKCVLNLETIAKGLQVMASKHSWHFNNFLNDNADAETGDVFVQCCVFGDVVYG
jgi:hypothetical protein